MFTRRLVRVAMNAYTRASNNCTDFIGRGSMHVLFCNFAHIVVLLASNSIAMLVTSSKLCWQAVDEHQAVIAHTSLCLWSDILTESTFDTCTVLELLPSLF